VSSHELSQAELAYWIGNEGGFVEGFLPVKIGKPAIAQGMDQFECFEAVKPSVQSNLALLVAFALLE